MRSRVGDIGEEARGQLTLQIQIPLLHGSILLDGKTGCRKTLQTETVSRHRRFRVAARWDDQGGAERTRSCAREDTGRSNRKSTRLNSSHGYISYAVFCLKKKNNNSMCRYHSA